ncbi:MAG: Ig-like domain-containing protein [Elusimicrobia bacterium]|nr:Ig-like domain-containing protein [Elusimicrobiota bacterium]
MFFFKTIAFASGLVYEDTSTAFSNGELKDLVIYNDTLRAENRWIEKNPPPFSLRSFAIAGGERIVLFGGTSSTSTWDTNFYSSRTFLFDANTQNWNEISVSSHPAKRIDCAMAEDGGGKFILFGGVGESGEFSDTWIFDGENWYQATPSTNPSRRQDFSMAKLEEGKILLFGGYSQGKYLSDTWIFDTQLEDWSRVDTSSYPSARANFALSNCGDGKIILYGGRQGDKFFSDTWIFDGVNWQEVYPSENPDKRFNLSITWDEKIKRVILFGGEHKDFASQPPEYPENLWFFNPQTNEWKEISPFTLSPPGREFYGFAHLKNYGNLLLGGSYIEGSTETIRGDFWVYFVSSSGTYTTKVYDTGVSVNPVTYKKISWSKIGGTVKFQVAGSSDGINFTFMGPQGEGSFYETSGSQVLLIDGKRFFRAKLFYEVPPDEISLYYVDWLKVQYSHKPESPQLYAKRLGDGETTSLTEPYFYWYNSYDADQDEHTYEIQVSTDLNFSVYKSSSGIAEYTEEYSFFNKIFLSEGKYYWRVRSKDDLEESEWSDVWSFFVDTTPPANITTLSALKVSSQKGSILLSWIYTGDDGLSGASTGFVHIKYKRYLPILVWTDPDVIEEIKISTHFAPGEGGSFVVTGLSNGTSYYFAVAIEDEAVEDGKNLSEISNNAFSWTASPPEITITNPSIYETFSETVTVSWEIHDRDYEEHLTEIFLSINSGVSFTKIADGLSDSTTFYHINTFAFHNSTSCFIKIVSSDAVLSSEAVSSQFEIKNKNYAPQITIQIPVSSETITGTENFSWEISDTNLTDEHFVSIYISSNNADFEEIVSNITQNTYEFQSFLYPNGTYWLLFEVWDNGSPPLSDTQKVSVYIYNDNHAPTSFSLLLPENNSTINTNTVDFSWEQAIDWDEGDKVRYEIIYSTTSDFSVFESSFTDANFFSDVFLDGKQYFWKVRAHDTKGLFRQSNEVFNFRVSVGSFAVFEIFPSDGSMNENLSQIKIKFTKAVLPSSINANTISLKEDAAQITYSYLLSDENTIIYISTSFLPNKVYEIQFGDLKDKDGGTITGKKNFSFKTLLPAYTSQTLNLCDGIVVRVSSSSFGEPCFINLSTTTSGGDLRQLLERSASAKFLYDYSYEIKAVNKSNSEVIPADNLEVEIPLNSVKGFVNGMPVSKIFVLTFSGKWQKAPQERLSDSIRFFSKTGVFALAGIKPAKTLTPSVRNIPNPFSDETAIYVNASAFVKIRVFALSGEEVFNDFVSPSQIPYVWKGVDKSGKNLPDGMYILEVETEGKKQRKLLGIIK